MGGSNSTSGDSHLPLASAELYDPSTRSWTNATGMIEARTSHTATMLMDGSVLVVGGARVSAEVGDPGLLASAEPYDYRTGAWTATGTMMEGRADHTATLLPGGAVLVAGGAASPDYQPASAELYDPQARSWSATRGINAIRYVLTATLVPNGLVAVVGDFGGSVVPATMELCDPSIGSWIATGRSVDLRKGYAATLLRDGTVLVSGSGPGTTLLGPAF